MHRFLSGWMPPARPLKATKLAGCESLGLTGLVRFARTATLALGLAAATLGTAWAQGYPARTVTLIVPFAVGSSTDIMTRLEARQLNERFKTSHFIVDNKAGASGVIGSDFVAKARPDGYTLLVGTGTTHTQAPWMMKTMPYDPLRDFEPVAGIGGVPLMIVVSHDSPIMTLDDLRKTVAAQPGKLAYGTAFGAATVCSETLKRGLGLDLVQVPYKSSPQAITDLMGGRIVMMCSDANTAMGPIRNKQLRPLAVTTAKRNAALPDLPTLAETLPAFPEMRSWVGVFAPKGTPPDILQQLVPAILAATESPDVLKALSPNGFERLTASGPALGSFVQSELAKWEKLISQAGIERE